MGKYKVGDKVRVRDDLELNEKYGGWVFREEMVETRGEVMKVTSTPSEIFPYRYGYGLEELPWVFTDAMLEPADVPDTNVGNKDNYDDKIIGIMRRQTEKGMEKYGVPLNENTTLTATQRIEHYQEEMIDGLRYAEHLKKCLEDNLTVNDYQRAAMRTANPECHDLSNVGLGLSGETGEVADIIKKHLHQGHNLDKEHLVEELGDVAWYLALAADTIGVSLEEILTRNIEKLKRRYPDGFDKERSIHREEKK